MPTADGWGHFITVLGDPTDCEVGKESFSLASKAALMLGDTQGN